MTRILHISKYYQPYIGGVEDVCYNIVNTLKEYSSISQQILCFNDTNKTVNDVVSGIPVRRAAIKGVLASQPISFCYTRVLKEIISLFQPTHIHFHAPNPLASLALLNAIPSHVKLIVHWHSDIVAQKFLYTLFKPFENRLLNRAEIVLATSPNYISDSSPLQRHLNKVEVLQNIIDPQKFELTPFVESQILELKAKYDNKHIVLFLGRHVEYKGLIYLIEAANYIKEECVILIGGNGPLTEKLKLAAKGNQKIQFVGRIKDDQLSAYFYACDLFVFPSITKNEAFGVALAEAMYCNTAAITFTIKGSGVNWVNLDKNTGIEVDNSNSEQLAQAIDTLLCNESLRETYSINAKQRIEAQMTIFSIKEKLKLLYQTN